jgi:hypothetical protein
LEIPGRGDSWEVPGGIPRKFLEGFLGNFWGNFWGSLCEVLAKLKKDAALCTASLQDFSSMGFHSLNN